MDRNTGKFACVKIGGHFVAQNVRRGFLLFCSISIHSEARDTKLKKDGKGSERNGCARRVAVVRGGEGQGATWNDLGSAGIFLLCCPLLVAHALISVLQATDASSFIITCMWSSTAQNEAALLHRFYVLCFK